MGGGAQGSQAATQEKIRPDPTWESQLPPPSDRIGRSANKNLTSRQTTDRASASVCPQYGMGHTLKVYS